MEMKGALTMHRAAPKKTGATSVESGEHKDNSQYYPMCPLKKKSVPITKCFGCEFASASVVGKTIGIGCNFPNRKGRK